jgi:UDP-2,3-diacylglucosamine hydrolase
MAERPYLIVSDIHLGAVPESTERAFRDFLGWVGGHASGLLINGDLFDFWFEYRTVIPRQHFRVLAALTDLVEAGVPVTFLGGNHDAWTGSVLSGDVGMEIAAEPLERTIAGRRAMVVHGDGVGEGTFPTASSARCCGAAPPSGASGGCTPTPAPASRTGPRRPRGG